MKNFGSELTKDGDIRVTNTRKIIEKVSKAAEDKLNLFKFLVCSIFIILLFIQVILAVYQVTTSQKKNISTKEPEAANPKVFKDRAKLELIKVKLSLVKVYILSRKGKQVAIDNTVYKVDNLDKSSIYLPFFYRYNDAQAFIENFLQKHSNIKVTSTTLAFIYQEYKTPGKLSNYILFQRKNGKWLTALLENVPVYFLKNKKTKAPYFHYWIGETTEVTFIPYFLEKEEVVRFTQKMGKDWEIGQNLLIPLAESIPAYEFGQAISIILLN